MSVPEAKKDNSKLICNIYLFISIFIVRIQCSDSKYIYAPISTIENNTYTLFYDLFLNNQQPSAYKTIIKIDRPSSQVNIVIEYLSNKDKNLFEENPNDLATLTFDAGYYFYEGQEIFKEFIYSVLESGYFSYDNWLNCDLEKIEKDDINLNPNDCSLDTFIRYRSPQILRESQKYCLSIKDMKLEEVFDNLKSYSTLFQLLKVEIVMLYYTYEETLSIQHLLNSKFPQLFDELKYIEIHFEYTENNIEKEDISRYILTSVNKDIIDNNNNQTTYLISSMELVHIHNCLIGQKFMDPSVLPSLETLNIHDICNPLKNYILDLYKQKQFKCLTSLCLKGLFYESSIASQYICELSSIPLSTFTSIDISNNNLGEKYLLTFINCLQNASLEHLKKLNISNNYITANVFSHLMTCIQTNSSLALKKLNIHGYMVSPEDLDLLWNTINKGCLKHLTHLYMSCCNLNYEFMKILFQIDDMKIPYLQLLDVTYLDDDPENESDWCINIQVRDIPHYEGWGITFFANPHCSLDTALLCNCLPSEEAVLDIRTLLLENKQENDIDSGEVAYSMEYYKRAYKMNLDIRERQLSNIYQFEFIDVQDNTDSGRFLTELFEKSYFQQVSIGLKEISIKNYYDTDETIANLFESIHAHCFPYLETLSLEQIHTNDLTYLFSRLAPGDFPALTKLSLSNMFLSFEEGEPLFEAFDSGVFPKLDTLVLSDNHFFDHTLRLLMQLIRDKKFMNIKVLDLSKNMFSFEAYMDFSEILSTDYFPQLELLFIHNAENYKLVTNNIIEVRNSFSSSDLWKNNCFKLTL
ncbi:hypothetical protein WA158_000538 [Blastocystis sp. Blastoise]